MKYLELDSEVLDFMILKSLINFQCCVYYFILLKIPKYIIPKYFSKIDE